MAKKPLMMEEDTAKRQYQTADPELKQILIESFGEDFFKEKITDRVKTFNDAQQIAGTHTGILVRGLYLDKEMDQKAYKYTQALIIAKALNEGWTPDFRNTKELKYYIGYDVVSDTFDVISCSYSISINTIYFKDNKLARYFIEIFPELCNILLK